MATKKADPAMKAAHEILQIMPKRRALALLRKMAREYRAQAREIGRQLKT